MLVSPDPCSDCRRSAEHIICSNLEIVETAISVGGAGVCMGRQIFEANDRIDRIRALRAVIHEGKTSNEAIQMMG